MQTGEAKVVQKKPDMLIKIKEARKQIDAGFLAEAKYPEWVANIVLVPKKNEQVLKIIFHFLILMCW